MTEPDERHGVGLFQVMTPELADEYITRIRVTERTFTVRYGLPRYQVRQHLVLHGIDFTEDKRDRDSVFTVSVTDLQWLEINEYAVEVKG